MMRAEITKTPQMPAVTKRMRKIVSILAPDRVFLADGHNLYPFRSLHIFVEDDECNRLDPSACACAFSTTVFSAALASAKAKSKPCHRDYYLVTDIDRFTYDISCHKKLFQARHGFLQH